MSYYLADANGYVRDLATVTGLKTFREWADEHPGPIRDFVNEGDTDDPTALADALGDASPADEANEDIRSSLEEAARKADGVLIISDGANNTLDDGGEGEDVELGFSDDEPHPSTKQPRHVNGKWTKGNAEAAAATTVDHHVAAAKHHRKVAEATTGREAEAHAEAAKRHDEAAASVRAGGSGVEAVSASKRAELESMLAVDRVK